jgi:hypothetical protein
MAYAQLSQNPYGPYVPMQTGVAAFDTTGHRPGIRTRLLVTALGGGFFYMVGIGLMVTAFVLHDRSLMLPLILGGEGVMLLGAILFYVRVGLALYWLHGAWKWIPIDQRFMKDGKRVTPGDVFMLLIPYYHFYWMFPINLGLCDAMERIRATYVREPRAEPPPRDTAMWAAICEIIPFGNFFVAPFLWGSYMRRIDLMHEEIITALGSQP